MKLLNRLVHAISEILPYVWAGLLTGVITMLVVIVLTALIRIFLMLLGVV